MCMAAACLLPLLGLLRLRRVLRGQLELAVGLALQVLRLALALHRQRRLRRFRSWTELASIPFPSISFEWHSGWSASSN